MGRKLKLLLGTTQFQSRVVDAETGEDIQGITGVHIAINASTKFTPVAEITAVVLDIEPAKKQTDAHADPPAGAAPVGEMEQMGKICYEILRSHCAWSDRWEELDREEQAAWETAAQAVGERVIAELQIAEKASE